MRLFTGVSFLSTVSALMMDVNSQVWVPSLTHHTPWVTSWEREKAEDSWSTRDITADINNATTGQPDSSSQQGQINCSGVNPLFKTASWGWDLHYSGSSWHWCLSCLFRLHLWPKTVHQCQHNSPWTRPHPRSCNNKCTSLPLWTNLLSLCRSLADLIFDFDIL